jgi:hypothetical protein
MRSTFFILIFIFGFTAYAEEPKTLLGPAPPYLPRLYDYSVELGLQSNRDDLLWVGALMGRHVGNCIFADSDTCQQYLDAIIGAGIREAETQGHFLASLRWQYINLPKRYSPYWRLIGGVASLHRPDTERGLHGVVGAGVGIVTYLHEKVDLRLEARALSLDRAYYQVTLGINIKVDKLLTFFAIKLRDFGYGTISTAIKATDTAIKATGEGIGGVVEGVKSPFKDRKHEELKDEKK